MSFSYNESRLPPCCPTPYPSTSCPPCSGGTTSAQDPTGPQGPQGPEGPPQGSQGAIGLQGPQGDPGTNASGLTAYGGLYNAGTQLVFFTAADTPIPVQLNAAMPLHNVVAGGNSTLIVQILQLKTEG